MALSDDERKVLEEMERQLQSGSSDVVNLDARPRLNATAATIGFLIIVAGIAVLLGGIIYRIPLIGVAGFGTMVVGVLIATTRRGSTGPASPRPSAPRAPRTSTSSFEDRWDRRMGGDL